LRQLLGLPGVGVSLVALAACGGRAPQKTAHAPVRAAHHFGLAATRRCLAARAVQIAVDDHPLFHGSQGNLFTHVRGMVVRFAFGRDESEGRRLYVTASSTAVGLDPQVNVDSDVRRTANVMYYTGDPLSPVAEAVIERCLPSSLGSA
jgi:hypothetical protein